MNRTDVEMSSGGTAYKLIRKHKYVNNKRVEDIKQAMCTHTNTTGVWFWQ